MKASHFIFLLVAFFLSGCTSQVVQSTPSVLDKNTVKITVKRDSRLWGAAFSAPIYINQVFVGKVGNGGVLNWIVQPGPVTVSTTEGIGAFKFEHTDNTAVSFNAEKGQTYTVKVLNPYQVSLIAPTFDVQLVNP